MNRIKYINPRTEQTAAVRICQPSYSTMAQAGRVWGLDFATMASADRGMARQGFIRAGRRWRGKAARAALRILRIRNALTDNATLARP